ncbi:MAG: hypothetical protein QOJ76_285 [Acidobacteriota bacterium]|jgi:hypothetical protein|nr:hypothetical protein [Acidobacteriota bacterium]
MVQGVIRHLPPSCANGYYESLEVIARAARIG